MSGVINQSASDAVSPDGPAPVSSYAKGSAVNLIRSLVVVLGVMAVLYLMVPRPQQDAARAFDVTAVARAAQREAARQVLLAQPIPGGWAAQQARHQPGDPAASWQAVYLAPAGTPVTVRQQWLPEQQGQLWLARQTRNAASAGTVRLAGVTWESVPLPPNAFWWRGRPVKCGWSVVRWTGGNSRTLPSR